MAQGVHGRRRVGQGETFWQFRHYQPGDAASRIDWRESAKSQRLYVRETEWEAAQSVWLWRDASASMDYSSAGYVAGAGWPTKRDRAELLLVALASLLVRGGERLTLLGSGVAPMSGRVALTALVAELIERATSRQATGLPAFEPLPRCRAAGADRRFPGAARSRSTPRSGASPAPGSRGICCRSPTPPRRTCRLPAASASRGSRSPTSWSISRVETVRDDYARAVPAASRRARRDRPGGRLERSAIHRTDRPPHLALLALHAALSPDRRR